MKTKTILLLPLLFAAAVSARAEAVVVQTDAFRLDLRPSPRVVQAGTTETGDERRAADIRPALGERRVPRR